MNRLRVLVFGNSPFDLRTITKGLMPFANVKEIAWQCKPLGNLSGKTLLKAFYRVIETCYRCLLLFKDIHGFKADVVLTQFAFHYGLIGGIAAKLARRPCVIQAIGSDLKLDPLLRTRRTIVCLALEIASGVICVSKDIESIAKTLGARNTVVIPYPLDLTDFPDGESPKKRNQIVSVMKLSSIKGIPYLIKAMTFIKEGTLLIIGDGPERKKSELLLHALGLQDRVFLLGWVDRKNMWRYLQQSTVFVLPSLSEGTPRVILEAMMCGLPIVATRVGGIPEMITDGVNGILVPPRNEKALAEAVRRVLNDSDFQRNASMTNRQAVKKFEVRVIGSKVYDYLRAFVGS
jgi:glycosyltransferase involved in cell wall biosynthesis